MTWRGSSTGWGRATAAPRETTIRSVIQSSMRSSSAKVAERSNQFMRKRRLEGLPAAIREPQTQPPGMQKLPAQTERRPAPIGIESIGHHGMTDEGEMHPDLMGAAGFDFDIEVAC